ncbi:DUF6602 domain-containing protein [Dokdonia sp.]|uniref:DUF6602 domain-containing protein n=1 Tax=Dokdonia sp. TaxID=2024995 RepID=UPI003264214B
MKKSLLFKYCEASLEVLNSQFNVSTLIKHNATNGMVREQIIKDFLKKHLPDLIHVVSGQIIDSKGNYTKQQDAVLVLKKSPRLPFSSGDDLIFTEGVLSTIEIKSQLNSSVLKSIGSNIRTVRNLQPSSKGASYTMPICKWKISRILTSIITYDGSSIETLKKAITALDESEKPDLILDLGKGLLVKNHGLLMEMSEDDQEYISISDPSKGLMLYLTFLIEIASNNATKNIKWRAYWD